MWGPCLCSEMLSLTLALGKTRRVKVSCSVMFELLVDLFPSFSGCEERLLPSVLGGFTRGDPPWWQARLLMRETTTQHHCCSQTGDSSAIVLKNEAMPPWPKRTCAFRSRGCWSHTHEQDGLSGMRVHESITLSPPPHSTGHHGSPSLTRALIQTFVVG